MLHPNTLLCAVGAAFIWAAVALQAAFSDTEPPASSFVLCGALVMVGVALGAISSLAFDGRRSGRFTPSPAERAEWLAGSFVISMIVTGIGVSAIFFDPPTHWARWVVVVGCLVVGGMSFGRAFTLSALGTHTVSGSAPARIDG